MNQTVSLEDGSLIGYEQLVIASGIELDHTGIPGLKEAIEDPDCPVASIYVKSSLEKLIKLRENLKPGSKAIFTEPPLPINCPGAP